MQWCEFQEYKFICDVTVLCRLMLKPILNSVKNERHYLPWNRDLDIDKGRIIEV